jgi:hypothetical protein
MEESERMEGGGARERGGTREVENSCSREKNNRTEKRKGCKPLLFKFKNDFCLKLVSSASIQKIYVNSNNENDN